MLPAWVWWSGAVVAGVYLLLRVRPFFVMLGNLLQLRYVEGRACAIDVSEIAPHEGEMLAPIERWETLGFAHVGWVGDGLALTLPPHRAPVFRVLERPDTGTHVWLHVMEAPERMDDVGAIVITDLDDGRRIETDDSIGTTVAWSTPPDRHLHRHASAASPAELVAIHDHDVARAGAPAVVTSFDEVIARYDAFHRETLGRGLRSGVFVSSPGGARLTASAALSTAWRFFLELATFQAARVARWQARGPSTAAPIGAELETWAGIDARRATRRSGTWLLAALVASGALFVASLWQHEATTIALITAIVVAHELGHWAAMRLRGYHDARIYLIPFLGGAAIGRKRRASTTDEMIVLLAGPLPGIVLAVALDAVAYHLELPRIFHSAAMLTFAINAFNMLPLQPLDGGKMVHHLVSRGRPVLEIVLRAAGAVGLVVLAFALESTWLGILGAILGWSTRSTWWLASAERTLRRAGATGDEDDALRARIVEHLRRASPAQSTHVRLQSAEQLHARLAAPIDSRTSRGAWLGAYLGITALCAAVAADVTNRIVADRAATIDVDDDPGVVVHVTCGTQSRARLRGDAEQLVLRAMWRGRRPDEAMNRLLAYSELSSEVCMTPPWAPASVPAERAARVAHTMATLRDARLEAVGRPATSAEELRRPRARAAERAALQTHALDPRFDRALAEAWLDARDRRLTPPHRPDPATTARLSAALGDPMRCTLSRPWLFMAGDDANLVPPTPERARWVLDYLCAAGAGSIEARQFLPLPELTPKRPVGLIDWAALLGAVS